jgi:large subunit ribosomal protein L9
MRVVLLEDVQNLGRKNEIKEVKPGYFRNFLQPKHLAEILTNQKLKEIETKKARLDKERKGLEVKSGAELERIGEYGIFTFEVPSTEKGKLYQAVTKKNIKEKLYSLGFKTIEEDWILLEKPLKEVGDFEVLIKSPFGKEIKIKIKIRPEEHSQS